MMGLSQGLVAHKGPGGAVAARRARRSLLDAASPVAVTTAHAGRPCAPLLRLALAFAPCRVVPRSGSPWLAVEPHPPSGRPSACRPWHAALMHCRRPVGPVGPTLFVLAPSPRPILPYIYAKLDPQPSQSPPSTACLSSAALCRPRLSQRVPACPSLSQARPYTSYPASRPPLHTPTHPHDHHPGHPYTSYLYTSLLTTAALHTPSSLSSTLSSTYTTPTLHPSVSSLGLLKSPDSTLSSARPTTSTPLLI
jgi:hypothetical protein